MDILIACECSQRVCQAFFDLGHNVYSCDLQSCKGILPGRHIVADVLPLLNGFCSFQTQDGKIHLLNKKWDMIIAHPPCTRLCSSGQRWLYYNNDYNKRLTLERDVAVAFFMAFVNADCDKIAIENPVGIMSRLYRKPDCYYNPFDFQGETDSKKTCLWLKGLPPLIPTQIIDKSLRTNSIHNAFFNGVYYSWKSDSCKYYRSLTPYGVAVAMAQQWGNL